MTAFVHYVNTSSTAGSQDGTTNTPGNSGTAAYESFAAYNTAEAADLTGDTYVVNLDGAGGADTSGNVQMTGWTNASVTEFVTLNGQNTGNRHIYDNSDYALEYTTTGTYQEGILFAEAYTVVNDLQIQITSAHNACKAYSVTAGFVDISRCIAVGVLSTGGGGANGGGFVSAGSDSGDWFSNLAYDWTETGTRGFFGATGTNTQSWYNCTARNCDVGFVRDYSNTRGRNLLAQDCTDGFNATTGWIATTSHNCSDIASDAPGTSTQTGEVLFTNEGGGDFELSASDTVALGNGFDLSGTFDFDLGNNTMPAAWPIGCMQEAAATNTFGVIPRRIPWTSKPPYQQVIPLDRSNPLNKDIEFAFLGNTQTGGALDLAKGKIGTRSGSAADVFINNDGANFGTTDTDSYEFDNTVSVNQTTPFTIFSLGEHSDGVESFPPSVCIIDTDEPADRGFVMFASDQGNYRPWNCGSGQDSATSGLAHIRPNRTSDNYVANTEYSMCVTYAGSDPGNAAQFNLYTDGQPETATASATYASQPTVAQIGGTDTHGWRGNIHAILFWNRVLSPAEILAVHDNPWRLLQPRTIFMPVASVGAATTVIITDVNTTETWDDGDTLLPITGTGFI